MSNAGFSLTEDQNIISRLWLHAKKIGKGFQKKKNQDSRIIRYTHACCITYDSWKNGSTLSEMADEMSKREISYWTSVLTRITDVTLTLASCNLAFRGHREKVGEPSSGNFLSIVELLFRYDPVLIKTY